MKVTTDKKGNKTLTLTTNDNIYLQEDCLSDGTFLIKLSTWTAFSHKIKLPPQCQEKLERGENFSYQAKEFVEPLPYITQIPDTCAGIKSEKVKDTMFRHWYRGAHELLIAILKHEFSAEPIGVDTEYLSLFPDHVQILTEEGHADKPIYTEIDGTPWIIVMPMDMRACRDYEKICQIIK